MGSWIVTGAFAGLIIFACALVVRSALRRDRLRRAKRDAIFAAALLALDDDVSDEYGDEKQPSADVALGRDAARHLADRGVR